MYDTTGTLISMERFQKIEVDIESETVRVGAGVSFAKLAAFLAEQNLAIETLPSLMHQSVVGSVMRGGHGDGIHEQTLANLFT